MFEDVRVGMTERAYMTVRNFVCELFYNNQGIRSLVCERPS